MKSQYIVYFNNEEVASVIHEIINKESVYVSHERWKEQNMKRVCPLIKEWRSNELNFRISTFDLDLNKSPKILQEIKKIKFPNLKMMNLRANKIQSLEGFHQIRLSRLQRLYIGTFVNIKAITASALLLISERESGQASLGYTSVKVY